jgi:hypothetical protein
VTGSQHSLSVRNGEAQPVRGGRGVVVGRRGGISVGGGLRPASCGRGRGGARDVPIVVDVDGLVSDGGDELSGKESRNNF